MSTTNRVVVWVQHFADRPYLMLQWHDPNTGQRKSQSARTCNPLEAEQKRADLEYELNNGLFREASRLSWERFRDLFEAEYLPGIRPGTGDCYRNALDLFEEAIRPTTLRSVDERSLSQFVAALRKRPVRGRVGMGANTIRTRLRLLHKVLAWARDQRLLPAVPKFPTVRVPKKTPQPVPAESFEKLIAKAKDQTMRAYLLTGWLAGLRLEEALLLEWEPTDKAPHLDLAEGRIVLPAEFVKGDADQWVPLDEELWEVLVALPRQGKKVFRFVSTKGRPLKRTGVSCRVIRLAKTAGVRLTMRSLRRGFGCRYASRVPAQVLQKLMRHSSITTTMDYYVNVDDAVMEAVRGKRNTSRNRGPEVVIRPEAELDANIGEERESNE